MRNHIMFLIVFVLFFLMTPTYGNPHLLTGSPFFDDLLPFDMCQVMPGSEVARLSPFPKSLKATKDQKDGLEGFAGCHYDFEEDRVGGYPQIDIQVEDYKTAATAREVLKDRIRVFKDDWKKDPNSIPALGDASFFFGTDTIWCDICNLVTISGRFWIELKFKGYSANEITAGQKQDSGVKLVKTLFEKKPFLQNKK